jgi:hypothetical protein
MAFKGSQPLILEYKKRRFDGGSEREMIEQIEYQCRIREQQHLEAALHQQATVPSHRQGAANPLPKPLPVQRIPAQQTFPEPQASQPEEKRSFSGNLYKAFIVPYVELVLGMSGILIGYLMIYSLFKGSLLSAEILRQERKALVHHSWAVIRSSLKQIALSPFVAVKLCVA